MAISKIRLPDNNVEDIKDIISDPYIVGTQTAKTNLWTGNAPFASLQAGQAIRYKLPFAGTSTAATLNLTLADGVTTTGAIAVIMNTTTDITTHYASGCVLYLTYDGTNWKHDADYNADTTYLLRSYYNHIPLSDAMYRYRLVFTSADGQTLVPANTSTSTNATAIRDVNQRPIDPFGSIYYYGSTTAKAAGESTADATLNMQYHSFVLGYSFNRTGAALNLTINKPIYLKCTPQSNGSAIMDADNPIVQSLPSSEDGKIYIFLGQAYSATSCGLEVNHPVYYYKDSTIRQWTNASDIKKVGFAQDIFYNPTGPYDTYISLFNHDKAQATAQDPKYAVEAISTRTEDNKYFIDITLGNRVRQSYTNSNNDYPLAIAGMQYSNMTSGNCLPVYYSPNVQVNPSTGILSVNDVSISGTSAAATISSLTANKQDKLISGTNIKTVNNTSLLGSGNIAVEDGKSAYQIWLDDGNVGTEADFLASLKGDTGVSADYPITIYNGLDSTATDEALAAVQGKLLNEKVTQLGKELSFKNFINIVEEGLAIVDKDLNIGVLINSDGVRAINSLNYTIE